MTFNVTVLGTSSALPTVSKHQTAHVLNVREQFYLIDAGEGVQVGLKRTDINMMKINHIFISHLHGDHVFGLFGLISTMGMLGREKPLHIYAPAPIKDIVDFHSRYFDKGLSFPIIINEVDTKSRGVIYENKVMSVSTIPLRHTVQAVGYIFREHEPELNIHHEAKEKYQLSIAECVRAKRGEDILREDSQIIKNEEITYKPYTPRTFAYCCDTSLKESFYTELQNINLLLIESTFLDIDRKIAKQRGHMTALQAATVAQKAGVKNMLLTHFSTRYNINKDEENPFLSEAKKVFSSTEIAKEYTTYYVNF